jgi:hypothetical protein
MSTTSTASISINTDGFLNYYTIGLGPDATFLTPSGEIVLGKKLHPALKLLWHGLTANFFHDYGFYLDYDSDIRKRADEIRHIQESKNGICFEDFVVQNVLSGGVYLINLEDDEKIFLTLELITENLIKAINDDESFFGRMIELRDEKDDAITTDCILQGLCFGEIIYG